MSLQRLAGVAGAQIEAVFFDLVGTLIRSRTSIGEQYAGYARRFGAAGADPERLGLAFTAAMRRAPAMAFPNRSLEETAAAERRWWRELVRGVVADAGLGKTLHGERFDRFFEELYDHFTTGEAWETYPDAIPALEHLQVRGLGVGLITNYDTRVYPVLDAVGLAPLLDSITIPALVGAAKPNRAIFRFALETAEVDASQSVYVGDEVGDDYAGAEAAGMSAVLIDREGRYAASGCRRIRSLMDLHV